MIICKDCLEKYYVSCEAHQYEKECSCDICENKKNCKDLPESGLVRK